MTTRHTDSMAQLAKSINSIGDAFELFKNANDSRIEALTYRLDVLKGEGADPGLVGELRARIEDLESRNDPRRPGRTASGDQTKATEHKSLFEAWLRKPREARTQQALGDFESKVVSIGSNPGGGFAVPEEISREIERLEKRFSPVRNLVKVVRTGTSDYKHIVNIRGATSGWVAETGTRTETATPVLRERVPTNGELYSYPQVTNWALEDIFFDVSAWLAEEVAQEFASEEGLAVISGSGTNRPTGMLNTTPTLDADFASPLRNANAYQYIPCTTSPTTLLPDCLVDLVYAVNSMYRANGTWVMNSSTAAVVRKMKDSQNQYLWQQGLIAGQPELLLGYPVAIWEQMPNIGGNNFPIAFGDFRRGYLLTDRTQINITVDPFTTPGFTKFYVRRREGGHILSNDAVKWVRTI